MAMLKVSIPAVKRVALESGLILAVGVVLAVLAWAAGLDAWLAHAVYAPEARWAWLVRQWSGPLLGVPVVLGGAFLLLAGAKQAKKYKNWHQLSAVMVLAVVLGMGLISQVAVQDLADRARPRDSILAADASLESLHGHSMPSGHAAMGFAFVSPFFLLRRKRPGAASGFLAFGLVAGGLIGFSRMVLGAHYLTDVWMAGVIALACGPVWAALVAHSGVVARKWWLGGLGLGLAALVLGNQFTLSFSFAVANDFKTTRLPCPLEVANDNAPVPTLDIYLTGYGAPVSQIYPVSDHGVVRLRKWGVYHSLACRAVLHAPTISYD